MHRLLALTCALMVGVALPCRAQMPPRATLDSVTRSVVVAGVIRALHDQLARTVTDTGNVPWVLFVGDSAGQWVRERAGLGRLLRAREPQGGDRHVGVLAVPAVTITQDSIRARFSVVYYERCSPGWSARGTDYEWTAQRTPTWAIEGPRIARLWDGPACTDVARNPSVGASAPFVDREKGSVPPAP